MKNKKSKRELPYDEKCKRKKKGIYRIEIIDKNNKNNEDNKYKKFFKYFYLHNNKPISKEDQERVDKLGLVPAHTNVWVSIDPKSKIQATGIDSKGRKQYKYHINHIKKAEEEKFIRLYKFIKKMPYLEDKMERDRTATILTKNRTISLMLYLVQELNLRVGKEMYAKMNNSYGICSLKKSHAKVEGETLKLSFLAKSKQEVSYTLKNKYVADEIKTLKQFNIEDEKLFTYISPNNNFVHIIDLDLNTYLKDAMGSNEFSVKDFRTYAANIHFVKALLSETKKRLPLDKLSIKQNINAAQEYTAYFLRHTKSISKKSYTMSLITDMYQIDPQWFIDNKNKKSLTVLIELLEIYKENLKNENV